MLQAGAPHLSLNSTWLLTSAFSHAVQVVDLPGVGVVGDPAGRVAEEFVQNDASALVIVARNNGLTEEIVGLLERTGVITRLLFGGDEDRITPIHIIFAITRLDDVAQDHWKRERTAAKAKNAPSPSREEVFARLAGEMERKTKEQIRRTLEKSPHFEDLSSELRQRREQVVRQLCDALEVICVSAKDFANLQTEEDRGLAFLQDDRATNIPHFRERLAGLAERAHGSRRGRITRALESFLSLLDSHLDALAVGAREVTVDPAPDAKRFREGVGEIVPAFQGRAAEQRRSVSAFLSEQIPPKLEELTEQASKRAQRHLDRLRHAGESLHWASLNAALVRNGTFNRQGIDYPGALTRSFVEVIASSWEPSIIEVVRKVKPITQGPIRTAEFIQLTSAKPEAKGDLAPIGTDFFAREVKPKDGLPAGVAQLVVASKLREVVAQIGFTRLEPVSPDLQGEYDLGVETAALGLTTNWLPASELRGEGVFIQFEEDAVRAWEERPAVLKRGKQLLAGYEAWCGTLVDAEAKKAAPPFPGVRFYMLHSLSHLLMSAISLECGYAASALRERIYCGPSHRDPTPMGAILLSTGTSGTEGTLGGLVNQGRQLRAHLQAAFDMGRLCSNDPVCSTHSPEKDHAERFLEGAACHGCLFIAECSCERFNRYLDRALVVPSIGHPAELAFFSQRP